MPEALMKLIGSPCWCTLYYCTEYAFLVSSRWPLSESGRRKITLLTPLFEGKFLIFKFCKKNFAFFVNGKYFRKQFASYFLQVHFTAYLRRFLTVYIIYILYRYCIAYNYYCIVCIIANLDLFVASWFLFKELFLLCSRILWQHS